MVIFIIDKYEFYRWFIASGYYVAEDVTTLQCWINFSFWFYAQLGDILQINHETYVKVKFRRVVVLLYLITNKQHVYESGEKNAGNL